MNKRINMRFLIGIFLCVAWLITACSRSSKETNSEQYEFDKDGRLIYRVIPDGSKIKYKYNNLGLPIKIEYPDDTVKYGYDANGNRIWMQNSNGKTEYKYDAFDRLIEAVFKYGPEKRIKYEYDPWDRITSIKILENNRIDYNVKYEYNILGNLKSIEDGSGKIKYSYYPEKGEVVRHLPNGIWTAYTYSPAGELISIKHLDKNNKLIASYRYEYSPTGKISQIFEEAPGGSKITKHDWDSKGYLKLLHLPDGSRIFYEYDKLGNRISMTNSKETITYSYDKFGRCIKVGDISYEWDNNGNLARTIERGSKTELRFDARNLPLLVKTPNETIKYKWDGDGHLISINAGKTISYFLPNPLSLSGYSLAEFDNLGRLKRSFLYGDSLMGWRDAIGNMHYYLEEGSNSIGKISDSEGFINQSTDVPLTEPIKSSKAGPKRESQPLQLFVREALAETPETVRVFNQVSMARRPEPTPESPPTPEPRPAPEPPLIPPIPPKLPQPPWIPPKLPVSNQGGKLDILVGGVTARSDDLNRQAQKLGFDIGIPVNRNLDRAPVFVRGVFDSIWAAQEQVTGGFLFPNTKNNLYNDLLSAKHIGTLEVHSHGAITFGNLYKEIDKALGDKTISINKVIFAGVYPHQKMVKVLEKHGVSYEIKTTMPYGTVAPYQGRYNDPIGLISMSNLTIGKSLMPDAHPIVQSVIGWVFGGSAKVGGLLSTLPVIPGPYSTKAHELEYINDSSDITTGHLRSTVSQNREKLSSQRNVLITDLGINQYDLKENTLTFVYDNHFIFRLPSANPNDPSYTKSYDTVKREAYEKIIEYFKKPNAQNVEVRVLQDVNFTGYMTGKLPWSEAQKRAHEFTEAFLEGLYQAKLRLGLVTIGAVASNAGSTFTDGTLSQHSKGNRPLDSIYFEDAQLEATKADKIIESFDSGRITFINVKGGLHGSVENLVGDAGKIVKRGELVANPRVAKDRARKFKDKEVEVIYFNPSGFVDLPKSIGKYEGRHTFIINHPRESIQSKLYDPVNGRDGKYEVRIFSNIIKEKFERLGGYFRKQNRLQEKDNNYDEREMRRKRTEPLQSRSDPPGYCFFCGGPPGGPGGGGPPRCPPYCGGPPGGSGGGGGPPKCPPNCGDGGGGGGRRGPFGGGFNDPFSFKSMEAKLGGIKLDAAAEFSGNLGNITGAVYDPEKQVMVLIGDEDISLPSIKPEDLAVALMSVFGTEPQDPQFSLDPADPKKPSGEWLKAVYIPERIIGGTEFGKALYEADWLLKQYAFGVRMDENNRLKERKSSVSGFKSTAELSYEEKGKDDGKEKWNRFWIVSDDMKLKQSGKSIYFESAKMRVKAKKQVPDKNSPTGLKDVDSEDDPVATKFAKGFTDLYDEIAKESPEFERIRQLAKAVAIAKWIKQEGIPFDTNWVNEYANKRTDTVGRVTALSTQWERTNQTPIQQGNQSGILTQIYRLHLFGGVDLTVKPKYISDDGTAQSIQNAASAKLRDKIVMPKFQIKHNGKSYNAIILPITANGQEIWKNSPITTADGTEYQFNKQGKVVKSIDSEDNITEYYWDANNRLNEFKYVTDNGLYITGKRKDDYSEITVTNPMKKKFLYRYNPAGNLSEFYVEGQRYAAIDYKKDETAIDYGNYQERLKFDNSGRVKHYEVYSSRDGAAPVSPEAVDINYDMYGNVTALNSHDTGSIRVAYDNGRIRSINTPRGKIDYFYEVQNGEIAGINTTWGKVVRYEYVENNLKKLSYKNSDYHTDVIYKDDLPVEVKDNNGNLTRYSYNSNKLLEQVTDSDGATWKYLYDNKNRVQTITLPDGSQMGFQFVFAHDKETEEDVLRKVKITQSGSKTSSSPITRTESVQKTREEKIPEIVKRRIEDIKDAAKKLKNGAIVDIYVEEKDVVYVNIANAGGGVTGVDPAASIELKKLLRMTATTTGKIGKTLLSRWQKFSDMHLSHLSKPILWKSQDGTIFKIKPVFIIQTNEVNYKYANLEKIPMLVDNFIIFIASKPKEPRDASKSVAYDLVNKINNIPKLTNRNVSFIIRLPDMDKTEREKWYKEIGNLQKIIDKDSVLVDPSKEDFDRMLQNKGKDIILIEMTHTDKGILLKNDVRYTARDIRDGSDLSHIKYLISGLGTCNLPRLENGRFEASLREKGVGIINASNKEVSSDVALKKLRELMVILRNLEKYDLYPYYLIDIINQKLGIPEDGTTNLGKIEFHRMYLFG